MIITSADICLILPNGGKSLGKICFRPKSGKNVFSFLAVFSFLRLVPSASNDLVLSGHVRLSIIFSKANCQLTKEFQSNWKATLGFLI